MTRRSTLMLRWQRLHTTVTRQRLVRIESTVPQTARQSSRV